MGIKRDYKLGFLLPFNNAKVSARHLRGYAYAQAVLIAMEEIQNNTSWNFNLSWVWNDTMINESLALKQQVWQLNHGVDAFIGPALSCATSSRNAVAFNKPVISYVSSLKKRGTKDLAYLEFFMLF